MPLAGVLEKNGWSYVVVDHNPAVIKVLQEKSVPCIYADATNDELYKELLDRGVKMVISTIRDTDDDRLIIKDTKTYDDDIVVMVVSNHVDEALELYDSGADYVIMPDYISAHHTGLILEEVGLDLEKILNKKAEHIDLIEEKVQLGLMSLFRK